MSTPSKGRVLVVDDERNITYVIRAMLEKSGYEALVFNDSTEALSAIDESMDAEDLDAVVTDLYMPGPGGMEILEHCKKNYPQLPVVIITAFGTVEAAVNALKTGAFDFSRESRKRIVDPATGLSNDPELPAALFPFQRDITRWALRSGRAAV